MRDQVFDTAALQLVFPVRPDEFLLLKDLGQTEHEWILGQISIDKRMPTFRFGWGFTLSRSSRFRKELAVVADQTIVFAIFRQFDGAEHDKPTAEYIAGWVHADREPLLEFWIAFLNHEIAARLRADGREPTVME